LVRQQLLKVPHVPILVTKCSLTRSVREKRTEHLGALLFDEKIEGRVEGRTKGHSCYVLRLWIAGRERLKITQGPLGRSRFAVDPLLAGVSTFGKRSLDQALFIRG